MLDKGKNLYIITFVNERGNLMSYDEEFVIRAIKNLQEKCYRREKECINDFIFYKLQGIIYELINNGFTFCFDDKKESFCIELACEDEVEYKELYIYESTDFLNLLNKLDIEIKKKNFTTSEGNHLFKYRLSLNRLDTLTSFIEELEHDNDYLYNSRYKETFLESLKVLINKASNENGLEDISISNAEKSIINDEEVINQFVNVILGLKESNEESIKYNDNNKLSAVASYNSTILRELYPVYLNPLFSILLKEAGINVSTNNSEVIYKINSKNLKQLSDFANYLDETIIYQTLNCIAGTEKNYVFDRILKSIIPGKHSWTKFISEFVLQSSVRILREEFDIFNDEELNTLLEKTKIKAGITDNKRYRNFIVQCFNFDIRSFPLLTDAFIRLQEKYGKNDYYVYSLPLIQKPITKSKSP